MAAERPGPQHFVARAVNLKTTGLTVAVPTTRTSRKMVVTGIYVVVTAASGATVGATIRATASSAGDVAANATMTNLAVDGVTNIPLAATQTAWSLVGAATISIDVTTGATATTLTGDVHVLGFFV